jgi:mannonate dehydratase
MRIEIPWLASNAGLGYLSLSRSCFHMAVMSRRNYMQGTLGALASAGVSSPAEAATPLRRARSKQSGGMQLSELFYLNDDHKVRLASQVGITHAIVSVSSRLSQVSRDQYVKELQSIKAHFESAGLKFAGVESHPVPAEKIKLGLPGRDEEIENYIAVIKALAQLGVPLLCYNWMAGIGWYRTRVDLPGRGGALLTEFDNEEAKKQGLTEWGEVSEDAIWRNLEYFLKAVIPVAEQVNVKMALHPDDPPLSPLRGIGRILTSAANFRRILNMVPSPVNGITFCQANFKLMEEDIAALAREWCAQKKLFFVHFRDVEGTRERFHETFHDNGPTDLAQMLQIYHEAGFEGPIRPDHAPTLDGETNERPGYAMGGKVLAIGYMKGVMDILGIPYA